MIFIILFFILLIFTAIGIILYWLIESCGAKHFIKFDYFLKSYAAEPYRWELEDSIVIYRDTVDWCYTRFKFHLVDFCIYTVWKHKLESKKRKFDTNKEYSKVMERIESGIKNGGIK